MPHVDEEDEYKDEDIFAVLPDDSEAEEGAAEQRALLVSFEMQRHDETVW
jgi:hypothetical protein